MARGQELVSARTRALEPYTPGEQPTGSDLVKLNTNENPYPCSPLVAEAIEAEARRLHLYPSPMADALRERAAALYGVDPSWILAGNGSDELLAVILRACTVPGDRVAYRVPTYSLYRTLVEIGGAEAVEVAGDAALADIDARVVFLCTPNSPTGRALSLEAIGDLARATRGVLVVDEAYVDFGGTSALAILAEHPNMVVTRTFSKSYSLAGLRLGLLFAHEDLVGLLARVKDSYNVSRLAIAAGVAALEDQAWMQANVSRVRATRARVAAALRAVGFAVEDSAANFLWVDCRTKGGGRAVYEHLRAGRVLVRWWGSPLLADGIRVSIGTDPDMDRFLELMRAV